MSCRPHWSRLRADHPVSDRRGWSNPTARQSARTRAHSFLHPLFCTSQLVTMSVSSSSAPCPWTRSVRLLRCWPPPTASTCSRERTFFCPTDVRHPQARSSHQSPIRQKSSRWALQLALVCVLPSLPCWQLIGFLTVQTVLHAPSLRTVQITLHCDESGCDPPTTLVT